MSILDRTGRAFSRQQNNGADPAHAFGSQEQIMAEFQRQSYVPPESAPRRAGAVLSSLRERMARPQRQYETEAPTYSAETYDQPAAPDLGWDAAFDPDARQEEAPPTAPSAQERFEAFRSTVYASPYPRQAYGSYNRDGSPLFEELSFTASPRREAPAPQAMYEEISFTAPAPQANTYQKPVYEELDLTGRRSAPQPPMTEAPPTSEGFYPDQAGQEYYPQQPGPEYYPQQPVAAAAPRQQGSLASDFIYFFWSMSILTGAALTLFSFIYAVVA